MIAISTEAGLRCLARRLHLCFKTARGHNNKTSWSGAKPFMLSLLNTNQETLR
ncbi:hypothetical protein CA54_22940 [Symmachiella macrocystis]|uniref:Uncharacterized protein n=1 Tax=Symmachiella macrocystis TaxID=2527985 RepID=A0A5C6BRC8_9PLAN|nr:hypothetical protein CA54_22940 [Symmachiella macrocystis]